MMNGSATITGSPNMFIGVASEEALGYLSLNPPHVVGAHTSGSSITYSSSVFTATWAATKKVSSGTVTDTAFGSNSSGVFIADTAKRSAALIEITKGSPNFTVQMAYCTNSVSILTDVSKNDLLNAMEASTMAGAAAALSGGAVTDIVNVAVDEGTDGPLNALCIAWNRTVATLELSEVRFRLVS